MGVITNPYCTNCGHVFPHHAKDGGPCGTKGCECQAFNSPKKLDETNPIPEGTVSERLAPKKVVKETTADVELLDPNESNLVKHARRELAIVNMRAQPGDEYSQEDIDGFIKVIQAFADMGHSGGSAPFAIGIISDLLQFKPLAPLTDNPDEWYFHGEERWGEKGGVWQNKRHGEAFSHDGGKSYYLLSEIQKGATADGRQRIMHHSMAVNKDVDPRPDVSAAPYDR